MRFVPPSLFVSLATVAALLAPAQVMAQDVVPTTWQSEVEFGFITHSGNTNTETINGKASTLNERTYWRNRATLEAMHTQDAANTTGEAYSASVKSKFKVDNRQYFFGLVKYESDRFSGYDYRSSGIVGYGQRVIAKEGITLDLEAGPGARQSKPEDEPVDHKKVAWLNGDFIWNIDKDTLLTEDIGAEISSSGNGANVFSSATSFKHRLNGSLAIKLSYALQYTSTVPEGVVKSDRKSTVTLAYSF